MYVCKLCLRIEKKTEKNMQTTAKTVLNAIHFVIVILIGKRICFQAKSRFSRFV